MRFSGIFTNLNFFVAFWLLWLRVIKLREMIDIRRAVSTLKKIHISIKVANACIGFVKINLLIRKDLGQVLTLERFDLDGFGR